MEVKTNSLVPTWARIKAADKLGPYLRICASLGINIEERARYYPAGIPEPKVRLFTVILDTPENISHLKATIAAHVCRAKLTLIDHIAADDLLPVPSDNFNRTRDVDDYQWAAGAYSRITRRRRQKKATWFDEMVTGPIGATTTTEPNHYDFSMFDID